MKTKAKKVIQLSDGSEAVIISENTGKKLAIVDLVTLKRLAEIATNSVDKETIMNSVISTLETKKNKKDFNGFVSEAEDFINFHNTVNSITEVKIEEEIMVGKFNDKL